MKTCHTTRVQPPRSRQSGFSLLELIVVVSIMAILAGSAIPVSRKLIDRAARKATTSELEVLAKAAGHHFEDTARLPTNVVDLLADSGLSGWTGPYLQTTGKDLRTGLDSAEVDGWSHRYELNQVGDSVLQLTSPGPDGVVGELEDYSIRLDITGQRRRRTIETLAILNAAVGRYNSNAVGSDPLPLQFDALLRRLVTSGFLPEVKGFEVDGWGVRFVADPPHALPVVRLASRNMKR
ncbi:MAG: prepilin-type N-terminal cleavage/methylation domain-containing protein [Planctomycetota bacterium]|jgi:prepilin-type N-terminal cleavage/methylation domain-containing protein